MTKRSDNTIDLAEFYHHVLLDVLAYYPQDRKDVLRDSKRITLQWQSQGIGFFTLALPEIGKRFDASLSSGHLDLSGIPHSRSAGRTSMIPKLFQGLWKRVFDDHGRLRVDPDITSIGFLRTLLYACKKVDLDCAPRYRFSTIKEFFNVEQSLTPVPEVWTSSSYEFTRKNCGHLRDYSNPNSPSPQLFPTNVDWRESGLLDSIQAVADRVASSFGPVPWLELVPKHGPGAVSDKTPKGKFSFPSWSPNLEAIFPSDWYGPNVDHILDQSEVDGGARNFDSIQYTEWHSKLCCVPKTQKGPRLIASEPTSGQWMQQAVADWLRWASASTLIGNCVNFFDQEPSRMGALQASRTGTRATIDLKSASDRMSCALVQRIFRSNFDLLDAFRACRTRYMRNSIDSKCSSLIKLNKYATQGSALTFPIQSILFAVISLGVGSFLNPRQSLDRLSKKVRVFGDDIIVPADWVPDLIRCLHLVGLRVNPLKTHTKGNFRESCGMDAFAGVEVTPVYLHSLSRDGLDGRQLASTLQVTNNFHMEGYWHTAAWMARTVRQVSSYPVVPVNAPACGHLSYNTKGLANDYHTISESFKIYEPQGSVDRNLRRPERAGREGAPRDNDERLPAARRDEPLANRNGSLPGITLRLGTLRFRFRWNHRLCRIEVRIPRVGSTRPSHERVRGEPDGLGGLLAHLLSRGSFRSLFDEDGADRYGQSGTSAWCETQSLRSYREQRMPHLRRSSRRVIEDPQLSRPRDADKSSAVVGWRWEDVSNLVGS